MIRLVYFTEFVKVNVDETPGKGLALCSSFLPQVMALLVRFTWEAHPLHHPRYYSYREIVEKWVDGQLMIIVYIHTHITAVVVDDDDDSDNYDIGYSNVNNNNDCNKHSLLLLLLSLLLL